MTLEQVRLPAKVEKSPHKDQFTPSRTSVQNGWCKSLSQDPRSLDFLCSSDITFVFLVSGLFHDFFFYAHLPP